MWGQWVPVSLYMGTVPALSTLATRPRRNDLSDPRGVLGLEEAAPLEDFELVLAIGQTQ